MNGTPSDAGVGHRELSQLDPKGIRPATKRLHGPGLKDVEKQMFEINQFANHRFLALSTLIGFVGAAFGVVLAFGKENPIENARTVLMASVVLNSGVFIMTLVDRRITTVMQLYAAWLRFFQVSGWEHDVKVMLDDDRTRKFFRPIAGFYVAIALGVALLPYIVALNLHWMPPGNTTYVPLRLIALFTTDSSTGPSFSPTSPGVLHGFFSVLWIALVIWAVISTPGHRTLQEIWQRTDDASE